MYRSEAATTQNNRRADRTFVDISSRLFVDDPIARYGAFMPALGTEKDSFLRRIFVRHWSAMTHSERTENPMVKTLSAMNYPDNSPFPGLNR